MPGIRAEAAGKTRQPPKEDEGQGLEREQQRDSDYACWSCDNQQRIWKLEEEAEAEKEEAEEEEVASTCDSLPK